jgi:hypothetical protein
MLAIQDMTVQQYCKLLHGDYLALLHDLARTEWTGQLACEPMQIPWLAFSYIESHLGHAGWGYGNPYKGWVLSHNALILYSFSIAASKSPIWEAHYGEMQTLNREILFLGAEWEQGLSWTYRGSILNLPKGELQVIELRLRHITTR